MKIKHFLLLIFAVCLLHTPENHTMEAREKNKLQKLLGNTEALNNLSHHEIQAWRKRLAPGDAMSKKDPKGTERLLKQFNTAINARAGGHEIRHHNRHGRREEKHAQEGQFPTITIRSNLQPNSPIDIEYNPNIDTIGTLIAHLQEIGDIPENSFAQLYVGENFEPEAHRTFIRDIEGPLALVVTQPEQPLEEPFFHQEQQPSRMREQKNRQEQPSQHQPLASENKEELEQKYEQEPSEKRKYFQDRAQWFETWTKNPVMHESKVLKELASDYSDFVFNAIKLLDQKEQGRLNTDFDSAYKQENVVTRIRQLRDIILEIQILLDLQPLSSVQNEIETGDVYSKQHPFKSKKAKKVARKHKKK